MFLTILSVLSVALPLIVVVYLAVLSIRPEIVSDRAPLKKKILELYSRKSSTVRADKPSGKNPSDRKNPDKVNEPKGAGKSGRWAKLKAGFAAKFSRKQAGKPEKSRDKPQGESPLVILARFIGTQLFVRFFWRFVIQNFDPKKPSFFIRF